MKRNSVLALAIISTLTLSACSKMTHSTTTTLSPDTHQVVVTPGESKKSIAPGTTAVTSITASFTIKKTAIAQDFFYGADLQYSSIYDKSEDLYTQSSANGHIPCFFRVNGKELQLIADNKRLYPSDVNHPEGILSRFTILSETDDSYVLSEANSAEYLATSIDSDAKSPRDHWARSFQYVSNGDYILQESSIVTDDGETVEMMESIFPRSTLTPSASFEKFEMNPHLRAGAAADAGAAFRYRFLDGESIFNGENEVAYAQHFDIGNNATIDWYATANISDEHLEVAREAVEGWNRYFKVMSGIQREVVKFKGRLPKDVKIGDPRYNVINWDSRTVAGAAYESQATDPFTGKQSHSLIYMPVAWFQIGMDYWTSGQYSDKKRAAKTKKLLAKYEPKCLRDLSGAAELLHSGRMSTVDAHAFSIQLMKQTLFHEVGHALGLAHNFKGSLSFDRADPTSMFSTSIMDYNDYEIERAAFTNANTAEGPLLEYDRQALSAIYNKMADVKSSDAKLPVCNDAEADTQAAGVVDPLCMRYDIEKDPTLSVTTALKRITEASLTGDVSLAQSLLQVKEQVLTVQALKDADTKEKHQALGAQLVAATNGVLNFYFLSGKASLASAVRSNIKSLYVFEHNILPAGYSELAMRERAYSGLTATLGMKDLPAPVKAALDQIAVDGSKALVGTTYALASGTDLTALQAAYLKVLQNAGPAYLADPNGMIKVKRAVMSAVVRVATLPLFFGTLEGTAYDFEANIVSVIFAEVMDKTLSVAERHTAAVVLAGYSGRGNADDLIKKASEQADAEVEAATDTASREAAIALSAALSG